MISVIVPIFNVERYLDNCVESIVNQIYKDLEIILIDDGSPDNCPELCDKWAKRDSRVKVIHKQNGGLSSARNAGIDVAKGDYISFVDGDDTIDKRMFYDIMENIADYDISICDYQIIKSNEIPNDNFDTISTKTLNNTELWDEVFGKLNNAVWNKVYKKEIIGNLRFKQDVIHGEDLLFNIEILNKCKSGISLSGKYYHYYKRQNSITTSKFNSNKFKEVTAKDNSLDLIKKYCPRMTNQAELYCFRSRMNILRMMCCQKFESEYPEKVNEYKKYIKKNISNVLQMLKFKERTEVFLYLYLKPIYKIIVRSIYR